MQTICFDVLAVHKLFQNTIIIISYCFQQHKRLVIVLKNKLSLPTSRTVKVQSADMPFRIIKHMVQYLHNESTFIVRS